MFLYPGHCVCGDTIFPGGPGKTWNHDQLLKSLDSIEEQGLRPARRNRSLPPATGANSTVAQSKAEVAGFRAAGRPAPDEFGDVTWEG